MINFPKSIVSEYLWIPENVVDGVTFSPNMQVVYDQIQSVAPTNATVLIHGETGTGKGIIARLIHLLSKRKNCPFVPVHCSAIPDSLMESELFGHTKGAFTGAIRDKLGKFHLGDTGTVFLDEIGTTPPATQIKLLQVLQDRLIQRVGEDKSATVDVRIIAATNEDLSALCATRQFRTDLYYRLNVFPIELPPLRERREDIPTLVNGFMERLNLVYEKKIPAIGDDLLEIFQSYDWPGNVREMENLVERAFILEKSSILSAKSLPFNLNPSRPCESIFPDSAENKELTLSELRQKAYEKIEREYLIAVLVANRGKINETSRIAGVTPRQINKLLTKYKIRKEDFK